MNQQRIERAFAELRAALAPLGVEIGSDTLALWADREHHGRDPLPAQALRRLAAVAEQLAADR